ncbi:hypothetical protein ILUMI_06321 [Ignelater luminosus]|uniref:Uncharacterized protein n=1 Tax=Ignelater luminosus TaxID=2038154 RepID=A0A8K0D5N5_IGNLU|nr:hypothetical protein ILUMI_06321 [Ignelater luminosus]
MPLITEGIIDADFLAANEAVISYKDQTLQLGSSSFDLVETTEGGYTRKVEARSEEQTIAIETAQAYQKGYVQWTEKIEEVTRNGRPCQTVIEMGELMGMNRSDRRECQDMYCTWRLWWETDGPTGIISVCCSCREVLKGLQYNLRYVEKHGHYDPRQIILFLRMPSTWCMSCIKYPLILVMQEYRLKNTVAIMKALAKSFDSIKSMEWSAMPSGATESLSQGNVTVSHPLLSATTYYLNKSKCKAVAVGWCPRQLTPQVQVHGFKNDCVCFSAEEWVKLTTLKEAIKTFLNVSESRRDPITCNQKIISFQDVNGRKTVKIRDCIQTEVWLGDQSLYQLLELFPIVEVRLVVLQEQKFADFYKYLVKGLSALEGNVDEQLKQVIAPLKATENVASFAEHWPKASDVPSAVRRLQAELRDLEFDADHEAEYGMGRLFSVEYCKALAEKYKTGYDLCQEYLDKRLGTQQLVSKLQKNDLGNFTSTIGKYMQGDDEESDVQRK